MIDARRYIEHRILRVEVVEEIESNFIIWEKYYINFKKGDTINRQNFENVLEIAIK